MKALQIPALVVAASLTVSCVRQVRTVSGLPPMPNEKSSSSNYSPMERTVQNARAVGEEAHRAALALGTKLDSLHNNLGYNLLMQGRSKEAAEEFGEALKLRPDSEVARNNLGIALAATPQEALLHWQSVSDPATAHS